MPDKNCSSCGIPFYCGKTAGKNTCWCADLPPVMPVPEPEVGCWCPACLGREISRRHGKPPCEGQASGPSCRI